jgi:predicted ester cyclase
MRTAFPDIHVTIDDILADGDKTVTRFTGTGTFKGEFKGFAPTGKKLILKGILITQWAGGKEVEAWAAYDMLTFYQQLGIPIPKQ